MPPSCAGELCRGVCRAYNIGRGGGGRHDAERPTLSGDAQSARPGRPSHHHPGRGPCGAGAACAPRLPSIHPPRLRLALLPCWSSPKGDRCACPPRQKKRYALTLRAARGTTSPGGDRRMRLVVPCSGCGAVAPHLDRGEACRRARGNAKGIAISKGCGVPCVRSLDGAPSHAAPAPAASAWYVSPSAPPRTDSSPEGDGLWAALRVNQAGTTLQPKQHRRLRSKPGWIEVFAMASSCKLLLADRALCGAEVVSNC